MAGANYGDCNNVTDHRFRPSDAETVDRTRTGAEGSVYADQRQKYTGRTTCRYTPHAVDEHRTDSSGEPSASLFDRLSLVQHPVNECSSAATAAAECSSDRARSTRQISTDVGVGDWRGTTGQVTCDLDSDVEADAVRTSDAAAGDETGFPSLCTSSESEAPGVTDTASWWWTGGGQRTVPFGSGRQLVVQCTEGTPPPQPHDDRLGAGFIAPVVGLRDVRSTTDVARADTTRSRWTPDVESVAAIERHRTSTLTTQSTDWKRLLDDVYSENDELREANKRQADMICNLRQQLEHLKRERSTTNGSHNQHRSALPEAESGLLAVLQAQVTLYQEDFDNERRDKERAISEKNSLLQQTTSLRHELTAAKTENEHLKRVLADMRADRQRQDAV